MKSSWGPVPKPVDDELLSSFLVRCALARGSSPTRFCSFHLPGIEVWSCDIDRSASDSLLEQVATGAGLSVERVEQMSLRTIEGVGMPRSAIGRGLTTLGVYHRTRRGFGLRCCTACLMDRPAFLRVWRVRRIVACTRHRRALIDACSRCAAPIVPHRQLIDGRLCHACHRPLAGAPIGVTEAISEWQTSFQTACRVGRISIDGRSIGIDAYSAGLELLLHARKIARGSDAITRLRGRLAAGEALAHWMAGWPRNWLAEAASAHLTQRTFRDAPRPVWLAAAIETLPAGRMNSSRDAAVQGVERTLIQLGRQRPKWWRTHRARILLRAAGRH